MERSGWRLGLTLGLVAALGAGCIGLARGDIWAGISTGDLGPCPYFTLDLVKDGDRIGGQAETQHDWGTTLWDVRGMVNGSQVTLETETGDPRVARRRLTWTGTFNPILWDLTLPPTPDCPAPRVARLQRR
jgi:hypothetical protein